MNFSQTTKDRASCAFAGAAGTTAQMVLFSIENLATVPAIAGVSVLSFWGAKTMSDQFRASSYAFGILGAFVALGIGVSQIYEIDDGQKIEQDYSNVYTKPKHEMMLV